MRAERLAVDGDPQAAAARVRALAPGAEAIGREVHAIEVAVRHGGDDALRAYARELDGLDGPIVVDRGRWTTALDELGADVRAGLEVAIANVSAVARAQLTDDLEVTLPQGHTVTLRDTPVDRAAIYVPGGRAPYPSTVVMGAVTARVAGVVEVVVCTPRPHPVVLAACALCEVDEVYAVGGAHGVAALAYGTETIRRVDVIAGPGNLWVQEAKRQLSAGVGIDGFLGPSDVLVLATGDADPALVSLDLRAQAEHGDGTIVVAVSDEATLLDALSLGDGETGAVAVLVDVPDLDSGLAFAEAFAPEHLELVGAAAEALAPRVRHAGCVFVGGRSATAFGDYVAGSNHSLPTGGSARYASGLGPRHFRRRHSEVRIGDAAEALARAAVPIAEAEGFDLHADSMRSRENG